MASIKDDKGFNQGYELVESTKVRMQRRAGFFLDAMPDKSGSALEIGCGTGEISYWMAQQTQIGITGTDICVPFIEYAQKTFHASNLSYEVLDFNHPETLFGKKFTYVFGNGILHHLYYHLDDVLINFKKLMEPGGKIIFMEPNIYNPFCALIFNIPFLRKATHLEPDEMAFSKSFITKKLKKAGYKNIKVSYRDFLLPGVPSFMIKPSIAIGNVLEKIPVVRGIAQSIFIEAEI